MSAADGGLDQAITRHPAGRAAACRNCGSTEGVARWSWDLDRPTLVLCGMCAFLLTHDPALFEERGVRKRGAAS